MAVYLDCPKCGWPVNKVSDSRPVDKGIRRRRVCEECGHRWTTYEFTVKEWMNRMKKAERTPEDGDTADQA